MTQQTVTVSLLIEGTPEPFSTVMLRGEQLPEIFDRAAILDLGNGVWEIVEAIPPDKTSFLKSGELSLFLKIPDGGWL